MWLLCLFCYHVKNPIHSRSSQVTKLDSCLALILKAMSLNSVLLDVDEVQCSVATQPPFSDDLTSREPLPQVFGYPAVFPPLQTRPQQVFIQYESYCGPVCRHVASILLLWFKMFQYHLMTFQVSWCFCCVLSALFFPAALCIPCCPCDIRTRETYVLFERN